MSSFAHHRHPQHLHRAPALEDTQVAQPRLALVDARRSSAARERRPGATATSSNRAAAPRRTHGLDASMPLV